MLKAIRNLFVLAVAFVLVGGGLYEWWSLVGRFQPHPITNDQTQITKILQAAGGVSPGLGGPKLYVVAYRADPALESLYLTDFPRLQDAAVDTTVIMIARPDAQGAAQSSADERSAVAELWVNKNWALFQRWMKASPQTWTGAGVPPADNDVARSAVVEVGRATVDKLTPLLKDNGLEFGYPLLVWWTKDGKMQAVVADDSRKVGHVMKDLGVK
jgi:hypothetical protein